MTAMRTDVSSLSASSQSTCRWSRYAAVVALAAWGILHVVGGAVLVAEASGGTGRPALESLGSAANEASIPTDPGPVVQALAQFHGLNIFIAGLAVAVLAATIVRTKWPTGVTTTLVVVAALDIGLVAFLVGPGKMRLVEGIWGPILAAAALVASISAGWRPRQL